MKKILFITGSQNQTNQMHQIAMQLMDEYDCWFSQIFPNYLFEKLVLKTSLMDKMVISEPFRLKAEKYMADNGLKCDYMAMRNKYDLVVFSTDVIVPFKLRDTKTIWVQEGMTDSNTIRTWIVKLLGLPRYMCMDTSLNGSSDICDIYCAASEGYKEQFAAIGTDPAKITVTGIPNFDHVKELLHNDFPLRDYVLVTTSDIRECYRRDDRIDFLHRCVSIAAGRPVIFKLHPNENKERAMREIRDVVGADTPIYTDGNPNHMIANCEELITQYSTLVYVGIILGKKVHSYFDLNELYRKVPIQNDGSSAKNIADICRGYIEYHGTGKEYLAQSFKTADSLAA